MIRYLQAPRVVTLQSFLWLKSALSLLLLLGMKTALPAQVYSPGQQWDKTIGESGLDFLTASIPTPDGGYLLGGNSSSEAGYEKSEKYRQNPGDNGLAQDYWIVKVDKNGNLEWDRTIGSGDNDYLTGLATTADGGYLVGGYTYANAGFEKTENSREYFLRTIGY
jgi:hypothetical protein